MKNQKYIMGEKLQDNSAKTSGYELLAIAICNQAAEDYRKAMKDYHKTKIKPDEAKAIERFFLSQYGYDLSFGLGEVILENLQRECAAGKKGSKKPRNSNLFSCVIGEKNDRT